MGSPRSGNLGEFHADLTYSYDATYTPVVQYFKTTGTANPVAWSATPAGIPDSEGWIAEFDFVPWGKPEYPEWYNAQAAIQYITYSKFDGSTAGASGNNTLLLHLKLSLAPGGLL